MFRKRPSAPDRTDQDDRFMNESISQSAARLRRDYRSEPLDREALDDCPVRQFATWFDQAVAAEIREPNAMTLSTVGLDGAPGSRTVLMKDFSDDRVTFYTNYESRKAGEIESQPAVALLFFWKELERQVHVRGRAEKTSREDSRHYFFSRPYESRIGAWASRQSETIPDREWLERRVAEFEARYPDTGEPDCVPLPDFWGGYLVRPLSVEFWQGQPGRKHDRFLYEAGENGWSIHRLSP